MKKIVAGGVACVAALALSLSALAAGTAPAQSGEMTLTGTVGAGAEQVISVTMPYKMLFTVKTAEAGTVESVLGAKSEVINNSNCEVELKITAVADPDDLLDYVRLAFSYKENEGDLVGKEAWLTKGGPQSTLLFTLDKDTSKIISVSGKAFDTNPKVPSGSYMVTPTITVEAVAAP